MSQAHWLEAQIILRYGRVTRYPLFANIAPSHHRAVLLRLAYSRRHNFFYARIPKAGNSTVAATLVDHMYPGALQADAAAAKASLSRAPTLAQYNRAFRFTVVRDPTDRVISAYLDKIARHRTTDADAAAHVGFLDFLRDLKARNYISNGHFLPQTAIMPGSLDNMNFIGRVENLDADLEHICSRIFRTYRARVDRKDHATDARDQRASFLTQQTTACIRDLYAADFDLLGYAPPVPLTE